jgi:hypothetical protein
MRRLIAGLAVMACVQAAAAAEPASPEAAHEDAERVLAEAFDGAGLNAVRLDGRPLVLAQLQPPGTIGGTETTTSTTTTTQTEPPPRRKWYQTNEARVAGFAVAVVVVVLVVLAVDDDDDAPAGTGGSNY